MLTTTLRTDPAAETNRPALSAPTGPTWADLLADVPGAVALWAAVQFGATLAPRGTCGEYPYTWTYVRGLDRWIREDGYGRCVEVDETAVGVGLTGDRYGVEVIEWTRSWQADRLNAAHDVRLEAEYCALAELAESMGAGELAAFRTAVVELHAADPFALDPGLYARLVGADSVDGEGEPEDDEDRLTGR